MKGNMNAMRETGSQSTAKSRIDTSSFEYLESRTCFVPRIATLEMVVALSYQIPGNIIEFGVFKGESTRCIRRAATRQQRRFGPRGWKEIYACDSFEGLQEKFENVEVGGLATEAPRISGVNIVKGYFEDTLTDELAARVGTVAFASLDADLYSSTLCALNWLTPLLRSGSLLLFDEFVGENQSEKRAFEEWMAEKGMTTVMIADFLREPAGRGENLDRRVLFQVVTEKELTAISPLPGAGAILKQQLQRAPSVYRAASKLRRLLRRQESTSAQHQDPDR